MIDIRVGNAKHSEAVKYGIEVSVSYSGSTVQVYRWLIFISVGFESFFNGSSYLLSPFSMAFSTGHNSVSALLILKSFFVKREGWAINLGVVP